MTSTPFTYKTSTILLPLLLISLLIVYKRVSYVAGEIRTGKNGSALPNITQENASGDTSGIVTLFLCGDVMTGRGIDQILRHPVSPELYESYMKDARGSMCSWQNEPTALSTTLSVMSIYGVMRLIN